MGYWGMFPRYVSVTEKRAKAGKKLKKLIKKYPNIKPVVINGSTLAHTWWGKAWNKNLEKYADYLNRIGRGRNYVRHGAVLDLQIKAGEIRSLVQGTRSTPYSIVIKISSINKAIWGNIKNICESKLDSMQDLLEGKFPKALNEIFTARGKGLFPSPEEIKFNCSCPDWAYMCKHVAATLYGTGARLDEDPMLFFKLRKAKVDELIAQTLKGKTKKLLGKSRKKSSRVIDDKKISSIFGIEMDNEPPVKKKAANKRITSAKRHVKKTTTTPSGKARSKKKISRKNVRGKPQKRKKLKMKPIKKKLKKTTKRQSHGKKTGK